MSRNIRVAAALAALFISTTSVLAADDKPATDMCSAVLGNSSFCPGKTIDMAKVIEATPTSPALSILGLNAQDAVSPSTPAELASSLLSGVDVNGNFQQGLAFDTNPYMLLAGRAVTLRNYQDSVLVRFLSNTQFSLATTKGTEDADKSVRAAIGLRFTPWIPAQGDPRRNTEHLECLGQAARPPVDISEPSPGSSEEAKKATEQAMATALKAAVDRCRDKWNENAWASSGWAVGIAPTWFSKSGDLDDLQAQGAAFWTSLAINLGNLTADIPGLENPGSLTFHARYRTDEPVPDNDNKGQFFHQDSFLGGMRLLLGRANLNFALAADAIIADRKDGMRDDSYYRFTAATEFQFTDRLWLTLSVGGETDRSDQNNRFALGTIKWNFSPDPTPMPK